MAATFRAIVRSILGQRPTARMLSGFVDSLLQTFENCRPGLTDAALKEPSATVDRFFAALYEKEKPRLEELVAIEHAHLSEPARRELVERIDSRIREVLIPAYARLARRLTLRERNDFYVSAGAWHGLERIGFAAAGMALGAFVVWAPFIPIYAKEWVAVFALGGLVYPELRRVLAFRRYAAELEGLVARTDDEIFRMDLTLLTQGSVRDPVVGDAAAAARPHAVSERTPPPKGRQGER